MTDSAALEHWLSNLSAHQNHLEGLFSQTAGPHLKSCQDSSSEVWSENFDSDQSPSGTDAAGLGTELEEALL